MSTRKRQSAWELGMYAEKVWELGPLFIAFDYYAHKWRWRLLWSKKERENFWEGFSK